MEFYFFDMNYKAWLNWIRALFTGKIRIMVSFQAEALNYANFLNGLLIIPIAVLWAFIPTLLLFEGICGHWNDNFTLRGHSPTN